MVIATISREENLFIVRTTIRDYGALCLTAETVAEEVKKVLEEYLEDYREKTKGGHHESLELYRKQAGQSETE